MPLTNNTSHLRHEALTKHTWEPQNDTLRYQASSSSTYKDDMFAHGDTSDVPHVTEYTHSHNDPQVKCTTAHHRMHSMQHHGTPMPYKEHLTQYTGTSGSHQEPNGGAYWWWHQHGVLYAPHSLTSKVPAWINQLWHIHMEPVPAQGRQVR